MFSRGIVVACGLLSSFAFIGTSLAQTVVLEPSADTSISREDTGNSNGAGQYLFVGSTGNMGGPALRRALVRFDLSSIPVEARIIDVSLTMNMSKTIASAQTLTLARLLEGWGEGTSDALADEGALAAATAGDATWLMRVFPDTAWTTAGGTIAGSTDASLLVDGLGVKTWTSAAMVSTAQGWLADLATNHGWLVQNTDETSATTAMRFDSRQHPTAANRPKLTVTYVMPTTLVDTTDGLDTFNSVFVQGNGNSGFGGGVGGGRLYIDSDIAGVVKIGIQRGAGNLDNPVVIYFDSVAGGEASTATYTDNGDGSRIAISGFSGGNRSTVTFPTGFRPDYALAYDARFGAFLFELIPGGSHEFVATVAAAGAAANATAEITMLMSDIGLAAGDSFGILGTLISDTAFRSDEWFGASVPPGNPGFGPATLENANFVIFQSVVSLCVPLDCDDEDPCTDDACVDGVCENTDNGTCQVEPGPEEVEVEPAPELTETEETEPVAEVVEVVEETEPVAEVVEVVEETEPGAEVVEVVEETEPGPEVVEVVEETEPGPDVNQPDASPEPGPDATETSSEPVEVVEPAPDTGGELDVTGGADSCGSCSGAGGAMTQVFFVLALVGLRWNTRRAPSRPV